MSTLSPSLLNNISLIVQHFSNAGFPCPIMQSPSDHFLRAINTDFDRIIAMCKNWQVLAFVFAVQVLNLLFLGSRCNLNLAVA